MHELHHFVGPHTLTAGSYDYVGPECPLLWKKQATPICLRSLHRTSTPDSISAVQEYMEPSTARCILPPRLNNLTIRRDNQPAISDRQDDREAPL